MTTFGLASDAPIRTAGLLRCCRRTLEETRIVEPPREGDVICCQGGHAAARIIFRQGAWEWDSPPPRRES